MIFTTVFMMSILLTNKTTERIRYVYLDVNAILMVGGRTGVLKVKTKVFVSFN